RKRWQARLTTRCRRTKASCHAFCLRKSRASLPLPLIASVRSTEDIVNGQWVGQYNGASNGQIVVNIDERRGNYQGVAYLNEDSRAIPSVAAFFRTTDKSREFSFRTDLILPINPL